ncbi:MAG: hypothetical protein ACYS5V_04960 [Planctomycetota bacterium]|jgi:hypothetical protein
MERFTTVCAACAAVALLSSGGCEPKSQTGLPAHAQALDGRSTVPLTPQQEYEQALADYEKAMKNYQRARFWTGAPKFYGVGPWAAPVAIGVEVIGHIHVSRAQAALEKAIERLEETEARLLASQWAPPPPVAPAIPAVASPLREPPPPPKDAGPVFNHPCPYCGAGNSWQGRRDQVNCNSCKKVFRIRYAR